MPATVKRNGATYVDVDAFDGVRLRVPPGHETVELFGILVPLDRVEFVRLQVDVADERRRLADGHHTGDFHALQLNG